MFPFVEIDPWRNLLKPECGPLLETLRHQTPLLPNTLARLRRSHSKDVVHAAIAYIDAQHKAQKKFPPHAIPKIADPVGVEQCTSYQIAQHKAQRFAQLKIPEVIDLCCGIGSDTYALNQVALTRAVDIRPLRAWMTFQNTGCPAVIADVTTLFLKDHIFHIDPSRRDENSSITRRQHRPQDYQPSFNFIMSLLSRCPSGAIKLGPWVNMNDLPPGEIEVISDRGNLVQIVLWTGQFYTVPRRATCFPQGVTLAGSPTDVPTDSLQEYLIEINPAVQRAGLMGLLCKQLNIPALSHTSRLLTSPKAIQTPWGTVFIVIKQAPWHFRKIKAWLTAHDAGIIEVKTTAKSLDANQLQKRLRCKGDTPFTVFVIQDGNQLSALIAQRLPEHESRAL
ncbi:MAG: hypothetical protein MK103_05865 [Planctomycetes bacterium]|nr:hypothetical protein [Planctomycetota bacterium]